MSKGGGPDGGRSRCSQNAGLAIFTAFCIIVGLDYLHLIRSTNTRGMPPPAGGSAAHTFTFDFTELPHGGRHFRVMHAAGREGSADSVLSMSEGLDLLRTDARFSLALGEYITSVPSAVFWECPPVSLKTASQQPFEFVVLRASRLDKVDADASTFATHFAPGGSCEDDDGHDDEGGRVTSFTNLGGDATLVVPCPHPRVPGGYAHLAAFLRSAPESHRIRFWAALGEKMTAELSARGTTTPVWMSTSGLGVYWLHARLDSTPKYYQHKPFKRWPLP